MCSIARRREQRSFANFANFCNYANNKVSIIFSIFDALVSVLLVKFPRTCVHYAFYAKLGRAQSSGKLFLQFRLKRIMDACSGKLHQKHAHDALEVSFLESCGHSWLSSIVIGPYCESKRL